MALNGLTDWDFRNKHVDPDIFNQGRDFISSESIVLCAGLPTFKSTSDIVPVGVVEGANLSQNKQINQLYEVGSRLSYLIPGRVYSQMGISRILFNGDSLLKAMSWFTRRYDTDTEIREIPSRPFAASTLGPTDPEDGKFFINLYSDFFNRPMGLCLVIHDSEDEAYGGAYLENAYIQSHQLNVTSSQTIVMENATVRCSNVIALSAEDLGGGTIITPETEWPTE